MRMYHAFRGRLTRAFTLIEVLVVVVILGILAAIIVPKIMGRPDQARVVAARQDILTIENALSMYKLDNGFYPSTEQGLSALVKRPTTAPLPANWAPGGYLPPGLPHDPWGAPYHYDNPGKHAEIDIYTYGANHRPTGKGINATLGNWNLGGRASQ